jgi:hypothetical protein
MAGAGTRPHRQRQNSPIWAAHMMIAQALLAAPNGGSARGYQ